MNDNEVICEIKWTVADVRRAFATRYRRQPTEAELSDCLMKVDSQALEDWSNENGWRFIEEAII